jgi:hypothetical protein
VLKELHLIHGCMEAIAQYSNMFLYLSLHMSVDTPFGSGPLSKEG